MKSKAERMKSETERMKSETERMKSEMESMESETTEYEKSAWELPPREIERRSMAQIEAELERRGVCLPEAERAVLRRVIHTTADFDYADTLCFSPGAVDTAKRLLTGGATIVTDTNMALAGINRPALERLHCRAVCLMADERVAALAGERGTTRAVVSMEQAAALPGVKLFAVGNAPTALLSLCRMQERGTFTPDFVIGVPVGFVNVTEAKERLLASGVPCIVARGQKGGSTVAAAVCNSLLYAVSPAAAE